MTRLLWIQRRTGNFGLHRGAPRGIHALLAPHTGYISNSGGRRSVAFEPVMCVETLRLLCRGCLLSSLGAQGGLISNCLPRPRRRSVQGLGPAEKPGGCWGRAYATGVLTANIWTADHVLANAGLTDVETKLEQFAVDAGCTPQRVVPTRLADQFPNVLGDGGPPGPAVADLPCPEQAEAFAMPSNDSFWLNDDEGRAPADPEPGQPCPEESISGGQLRSLHRALQHAELVAQSKDLKLKGRSGAEQRQKGTRRML
jgi:hypothetical protein